MKYTQTYQSLNAVMYQTVAPTPVNHPSLLCWNTALANQLGLRRFSDDEKAAIFSGNQLLDEQQPIALAYSGHQFGGFNPQLGDGRAHLIAEIESEDGASFDVHLKGSGQTKYSRRGDGRCALKPAIREFIMSEAMAGLGIPTTRTLAVVATGETVWRTGAEPGAVVTRIAKSHLRIGTFQYAAQQGDLSVLEALLDYAIARHYPEITAKDTSTKVTAFIRAVMQKQIETLTGWMRVGFIHGVMNTDNATISGETIDFGPCAMMGAYHPETVYSSIDTEGRYCFSNQAPITQWNLARLAESLLPLYGDAQEQGLKELEPLIVQFKADFEYAFYHMMLRKLGIETEDIEQYEKLVDDLLALMQVEKRDYTQTFVFLGALLGGSDDVALSEQSDAFQTWVQAWRDVLSQVEEKQSVSPVTVMAQVNPLVIPRNHHVERILSACEQGDLSELHAFVAVLSRPYEMQDATINYQDSPVDGDKDYQTFCGT
ncbi:protein adenylyltransferase SelO [Thaumasiovibrio subtropicus]|uniref:protein adenylyltransferase SelO n=1 Tax=Thaumasiovibrio subtropicus TaxID=1891207 RepID=UPI000B36049D|nr:YdiU family protein [Thaumasiovibrio subtropicus]